jgi:hypothetical protein
MHAPQYYLAGLPVAFLGKSQLRFIAERLLLELWAPAKVWQPEAYRPLADMLSCYAFLNVQRRSADRDEETVAEKAPKIITTGNVPGEIVPEEQELDTIESLPLLASLDCQTCGKPLQRNKVLSEPKGDIIAVRFYCAECDKYQSNRVSLSWLESLRQNAPVQS